MHIRFVSLVVHYLIGSKGQRSRSPGQHVYVDLCGDSDTNSKPEYFAKFTFGHKFQILRHVI